MQDSRDVGKRHAEHVVQHKRQPLGGTQRIQHHEQREPDRVGNQRLLLGPALSSRLTTGSGACTSESRSRRARRARSMFKHTRPTMVVSQACTFSTLRGSWPRIRSHASWSASSASLTDPSMR